MSTVNPGLNPNPQGFLPAPPPELFTPATMGVPGALGHLIPAAAAGPAAGPNPVFPSVSNLSDRNYRSFRYSPIRTSGDNQPSRLQQLKNKVVSFFTRETDGSRASSSSFDNDDEPAFSVASTKSLPERVREGVSAGASKVGTVFMTYIGSPVKSFYDARRAAYNPVNFESFLADKAKVGFTAADKLRFAYVDYKKAKGFAKVAAWFKLGGLGALVAGSMDKESDGFRLLEEQAKFYKQVCAATEAFGRLVSKAPFAQPNLDKLNAATGAFEAIDVTATNGDHIRTILSKQAGVESFTGTLLEYYAQLMVGEDVNTIREFFMHTTFSNYLQVLYDKGYRGAATAEELDNNKTRLEALNENGMPIYRKELRPILISFEKGLKRSVLKDPKTVDLLGRARHSFIQSPEGIGRLVDAEYTANNQAIADYFNGKTNGMPVIEGIPGDIMRELLRAANAYRDARAALRENENDLQDAYISQARAEQELSRYTSRTNPGNSVDVGHQELIRLLDSYIDETAAADAESLPTFTVQGSPGVFAQAVQDRIAFRENEAKIDIFNARKAALELRMRQEADAEHKKTAQEFSRITLVTSDDLSDIPGVVDTKKQRVALRADLERMEKLDANIARATKPFNKQIEALRKQQAALQAKRYNLKHADIVELDPSVVLVCPGSVQAIARKGDGLRQAEKRANAEVQSLHAAKLELAQALVGTKNPGSLPDYVTFDGTNFEVNVMPHMYAEEHHQDRVEALAREYEQTIDHIDTIVHISGIVFRRRQFQNDFTGRLGDFTTKQDRRRVDALSRVSVSPSSSLAKGSASASRMGPVAQKPRRGKGDADSSDELDNPAVNVEQ